MFGSVSNVPGKEKERETEREKRKSRKKSQKKEPGVWMATRACPPS